MMVYTGGAWAWAWVANWGGLADTLCCMLVPYGGAAGWGYYPNWLWSCKTGALPGLLALENNAFWVIILAC